MVKYTQIEKLNDNFCKKRKKLKDKIHEMMKAKR